MVGLTHFKQKYIYIYIYTNAKTNEKQIKQTDYIFQKYFYFILLTRFYNKLLTKLVIFLKIQNDIFKIKIVNMVIKKIKENLLYFNILKFYRNVSERACCRSKMSQSGRVVGDYLVDRHIHTWWVDIFISDRVHFRCFGRRSIRCSRDSCGYQEDIYGQA